MSRLILPCKASSFSKTCLLGFVSSAPLRGSCRARSYSVKSICSYRQSFSSKVTNWQKFGLPYSALHRSTDKKSRSLICSVATEPLPKQIEDSVMESPKEIFLKDYKQPDYFFDSVDLKFTLGEENTIVSSKIVVTPRAEGVSSPLVLDGVDMKLVSVKVNGNGLKEDSFQVDSRHLTLSMPPSGKFTLEIVTEIQPQNNTS